MAVLDEFNITANPEGSSFSSTPTVVTETSTSKFVGVVIPQRLKTQRNESEEDVAIDAASKFLSSVVKSSNNTESPGTFAFIPDSRPCLVHYNSLS
jgi:hypothetical protein